MFARTSTAAEYFPFLGAAAGYSSDRSFAFPMTCDQYGNGAADGVVFQIDDNHGRYLAEKRSILDRFASQHVCRADASGRAPAAGTTGAADVAAALESAACTLIRHRLLAEHGDRFNAADLAAKSFDELAMMVQEDLAIHCATADGGRDWLAAAHVCFPSGWNPAGKVGRSFAAIHAPVRVQARSFLSESETGGGPLRDYVGSMMRADSPQVRFVWSLQCGRRLNQNPALPAQREPFHLDPGGRPNTHLRVERQTITALSLPADLCRAALFTIRIHLYPILDVIADDQRRAALRDAIGAMPPWQRRYKNWDERMIGDLAGRLGDR